MTEKGESLLMSLFTICVASLPYTLYQTICYEQNNGHHNHRVVSTCQNWLACLASVQSIILTGWCCKILKNNHSGNGTCYFEEIRRTRLKRILKIGTFCLSNQFWQMESTLKEHATFSNQGEYQCDMLHNILGEIQSASKNSEIYKCKLSKLGLRLTPKQLRRLI